MFPFFTAFVIFIIVLNISIRKNDRKQALAEEEYWKKELAANSTRKQDISQLDYITIPLEKIPQNLHTEAEKKLLALVDCPMLNLEGQSNTDLKLTYGVANLEILGSYEENFAKFQTVLPVYAKELIDAGNEAAATDLLEYAVSHQAASRPIYLLLADIYCSQQNEKKLSELLDQAKALTSMSGTIIMKDLTKHMDALHQA